MEASRTLGVETECCHHHPVELFSYLMSDEHCMIGHKFEVGVARKYCLFSWCEQQWITFRAAVD